MGRTAAASKDLKTVTKAGLSQDADLERKIILLKQNNAPVDVIAKVLDVSKERVEDALWRPSSGLSSTVDVTWNQSFLFMLADPKLSHVAIEVFKSSPRIEDKSVGKVVYPVKNLLNSASLREDLKRTPLQGNHPEVKVSAKVGLRTLVQDEFPRPQGLVEPLTPRLEREKVVGAKGSEVGQPRPTFAKAGEFVQAPIAFQGNQQVRTSPPLIAPANQRFTQPVLQQQHQQYR